MKILITGIGITGKSSFRRFLVDFLKKYGWAVEQYDADEFKELRDVRDINCKMPEKFDAQTMYVIEDIHGTILNESFLTIKEYDLIFYLLPNLFSHIMFWLPRMWKWFQIGHYSWEKTGWKGTGKSYDLRNIIPIIKAFLCDMQNRKKWIEEDLRVIKSKRHHVIRPIRKISGIYCIFLGKKIRLQ